MKLGKTSWLILTLGIIIVAFVSLGIARSQQIQEQKQLDEKLSVAELRLDQLQLKQLYAQKNELEGRLSETTIQLEAAKNALRQSIESIEVTDSLFEIAEACGVEIAEISSSELGSDTLGEITCSVIRLTLSVEGDVPNLILFIIKLNNGFTTGVVRSVEINIQEEADEEADEETEGEQFEEEIKKPSANIRLVIYTYQGD